MRYLTAILIAVTLAAHAQTVRVKDLARIEGVRSNQLVGYGLVVGLEGTGDSKQTLFTAQSTANMLSRMGVNVASGQINLKNVAAVMVTTDLPAFARNGDHLDVTVSSLGDARSLQGGTLLQTPLSGADGVVYAVAQGSISIGGFTAGGGGSTTVKNHPTVGRVPNGALVEREVSMTIADNGSLVYSLNRADFSSAARIAKAVEVATGASASAVDAGRVKVAIPAAYRGNPVPFVAQVDEVSVEVEPVAKVVINERTGTIVIGGAVRLSPVAVAHAGLTVSVKSTPVVSQPNPLSKGGTTVITPKVKTTVSEPTANTLLIDGGDTVEDLIKALNAIKATPRDIIAIVQAIKEAGGLQAELEIL